MFRISPPAGLVRSTLLASAAVFAAPFDAEAQSERSNLPPVTVTAPEQKRAASARPPRNTAQSARTVRQARNASPPPQVPSDQGQGVRGALAVLSAQQALTEINNTPGGVALVPAEAYKNSTVANTIKDILDYVPGVFAQPKSGDDTRLSIRGSGLSRNFHLRGVQLYMDGIPINTADGYGDFQEIDPTACKYVEVWKGANALQFGANSLGGAINFVIPTGRDPFPNGVSADMGAFGFKRLQANAGGANGPWDGFVTAATQASDGFRDHSLGSSTRVSGNVGYQFSPEAEIRFYFNANQVRQRIPGTVTKQSALTNPEAAAPANVAFGNCNVTNADRTIHQGIEAGAGAAIFRGIFNNGPAPDKIWLNLAYTFNDFRFDNDPTFGNNLLPGAPRHYLRAELLYKHAEGFYFGPNVEWVPESYYVDSANTLRTSAYALLGLKTGFDNGGPLTAYVEGRNLLNKAYIASTSIINQATATSPLFEPGTRRAVYAGI